VFGGDLNLRTAAFPGLRHVAGHFVDHLFTDGRPAAGRGETLERGRLSDHAPVAVELA
jgi:endonuclease/exonuclease/phosphatase family metal-dependent hydrolase